MRKKISMSMFVVAGLFCLTGEGPAVILAAGVIIAAIFVWK